MAIKVGISEMYAGYDGRDGAWMLHSAQLLESVGFNSIWVAERHVYFPEWKEHHPYGTQTHKEAVNMRSLFEGLTALSAIAVVTNRVKIGTYVAIPSIREPIVTARAIATIDQISEGRFVFGVGSSWVGTEHEMMGHPFKGRGARIDENLRAMKEIWTTEVTEFHGEYLDYPPSYIGPKPFQKPHPPIAVGGNSAATIRRIVALGDRWIGYGLELPEIEQFIERLHAALREAGRDPSEVTLSIGARLPDRFGLMHERPNRDHWPALREYIEGCEQLGLEEVVVSTRFSLEGYDQDIAAFAEALDVSAGQPVAR